VSQRDVDQRLDSSVAMTVDTSVVCDPRSTVNAENPRDDVVRLRAGRTVLRAEQTSLEIDRQPVHSHRLPGLERQREHSSAARSVRILWDRAVPAVMTLTSTSRGLLVLCLGTGQGTPSVP
jgi:hypothetical protein